MQIQNNGDIATDPNIDKTPASGGDARIFFACHDIQYNVTMLLLGNTQTQFPNAALGDVVERYEYTPYGQRQVYTSAGTSDPDCYKVRFLSKRLDDPAAVESPVALCTVGFQGLHLDEITGNYNNRARIYNPTSGGGGQGRFLQRDPLGYPDGMNTYAAYHVMRQGVDPSGFRTEWFKEGLRSTSLHKGWYGAIAAKINDTLTPGFKIRKPDTECDCIEVQLKITRETIYWEFKEYQIHYDLYREYYVIPEVEARADLMNDFVFYVGAPVTVFTRNPVVAGFFIGIGGAAQITDKILKYKPLSSTRKDVVGSTFEVLQTTTSKHNQLQSVEMVDAPGECFNDEHGPEYAKFLQALLRSSVRKPFHDTDENLIIKVE